MTHQWPFWKRVLCLTQPSILIGFQSWRLENWRHLRGFWDREGTLHQAKDPRWNKSALPFIVLFPLRLYHNKAPYALRHVPEEQRGDNKVENSDDSKLNGVQRLGTTWGYWRKEPFCFCLFATFIGVHGAKKLWLPLCQLCKAIFGWSIHLWALASLQLS